MRVMRLEHGFGFRGFTANDVKKTAVPCVFYVDSQVMSVHNFRVMSASLVRAMWSGYM